MKLLALMKKEFLRFFQDPRMIITMLLPGIIIYCFYSLIGYVMWEEKEEYQFKVYTSGTSVCLTTIAAAVGINGEVTYIEAESAEQAKAAVESGEATAYIAFSEGFDEAVANYNGAVSATVEVYYDSNDTASNLFYSVASGILSGYERQFFFLSQSCVSEEELFTSTMASALPLLIAMLIFSTSMSVTLESVAGEKERGTLATILVTPAKRSDITLGKVLPLSCISLIGAVSSFLGLFLSLPKLMGMSVSSMMSGISFLGYFLLFLQILSIVPVFVCLLAVLSTYAKTVKEASAYAGVSMIFVIVLSVVAAFVPSLGSWVVCVPILNALSVMQAIIGMNVVVWEALVAVLCNLFYTVLLVLAIAKMLSSERIMFGK